MAVAVKWDERQFKDGEIGVMKGKVLTDVVGCHRGSGEIVFHCDDGTKYRMNHHRD